MDVKDIIAKVSGNKDLVEQIKKADPKQVKGLLDKAGVKVDESDAKAVKAALSDGKLDLNDIKNIAGGLFKQDKGEDPCLKDIGILASLDPVAIDRACLDLVYASKDVGRDHFLERVTSRNGEHTVDTAAKLGVGSLQYELIELQDLQKEQFFRCLI